MMGAGEAFASAFSDATDERTGAFVDLGLRGVANKHTPLLCCDAT